MTELEILPDFSLTSFGGLMETKDIMHYLANSISYSISKMSDLRAYKPKNKYTTEIRSLLFTGSMNFTYYSNNRESINYIASATEIGYLIASYIGKPLENEIITPETAKGTDSLTGRYNNDQAVEAMDKAMGIMIKCIKNINVEYQLYYKIVLIIEFCIILIILPIFHAIQVKRSDQTELQYLKHSHSFQKQLFQVFLQVSLN